METKIEKKILNLLLTNMEEGVHIVDKNGVTVIYNNAMESIEGLNPAEVIGKHLSDVFPHLNTDNSTLLQALKYGRVVENYRQDYTNLRGTKISTINHTYPVMVEGEVMGAVELSSNVTDVRELSSTLERLQSAEIEDHDVPNYYTFDSIISVSERMREALDLAKKSARLDSTILIVGDTGTGKELFAQSIHNASKRAKRPFVAVNVASLAESLLESLLFGSVRGAYTGATDSKGLFEQAHQGTLFLDEINAMSLNLQTKLLRVLQEGFIRRVGGTKDIKVNVRIIAATNRNPKAMLDEGTLRSDLYYRLNVMRIDLPSLDDRKDDVEPLVRYFIGRFNDKLGKDIQSVEPELMTKFRQRRYRGNVRELEHLIESAMNLKEEGSMLLLSDMPDHFFVDLDDRYISYYKEDKPLSEYMDEIEKSLILAAFGRENGNVSKTAARLGIPRQNLQYKLKKYGVKESNQPTEKYFAL